MSSYHDYIVRGTEMAYPQPSPGIMAEAMTRAGVVRRKTAVDRLSELWTEAVKRFDSDAQAIVYFSRKLIEANDAEMMWELFAGEREIVLRRQCDATRRALNPPPETRGTDNRSGHDVAAPDRGHSFRAAPVTPSPQREAIGPASAQVGRPPTASPAAKPYVPSSAMRDIATGVLLRTRVNGQPIADCTAGEVRSWIRCQHTHTRFAERLAQGPRRSRSPPIREPVLHPRRAKGVEFGPRGNSHKRGRQDAAEPRPTRRG